MTVYVDPLAHANVTPERIDMGVDYAGTGQYDALGRAVITDISPGGWGQWGNWVEYQLLDGPDKGRQVYYAEGVNAVPGLHVGQIVPAGAPVVNLIPGWHSGTEIGWAGAGGSTQTYAAQYGGGYTEGEATAAGRAFSGLVASLGGPAGKIEGPLGGTFSGAIPTGTPAAGAAPGGSSGGGLLGLPSWIGDISNFLSDPLKGVLTVALVLGGAFVFYKGVTRTLGGDQPAPATRSRFVPVPV